ncbi:MAG: GHKL domain-containing protein [Bdellovibrio sp.]|nr:MAG: GHKL domain-containing protein [Bdellovibrio sp.]
MTHHKKIKPTKSLRTLLMLWFIFFSVAPLAFITGYSLVKYEKAINRELFQRLQSNRREIEVIFADFEKALYEQTRHYANNQALKYHLSQDHLSQVRKLAKPWLQNSIAQTLSIFDSTGKLEVALYKTSKGEVKRNRKYESREWVLAEDYLKKISEKPVSVWFDVNRSKTLDLLVIAQIISKNGVLIGFLEQRIRVDKDFLQALKNRMNLEIFIVFENDEKNIVSSDPDFALYQPKFFKQKFKEVQNNMFDLTLKNQPFGISLAPLQWGENHFLLGLAASKKEAFTILKNIKLAFYTVVGTIVILLILLSIVISKLLLKPLYDLVYSIERMDPETGKLESIPESPNNEIGVVIESFKELANRVQQTQLELKKKIRELEKANTEIKEAQAKLVHSAKMASLGQLVAGVAHELNNPIGFIYSNMQHLREYSEKLIELSQVAEKDPSKISKFKKDIEFDYIVQDLPKLIRSCEEGAKRTRDIVLGLRNFSRLEEAKIKDINIHENIDTTLSLLQGELKGRIQVVKDYDKNLPLVPCYPNQINQVFMNILSNAAQAIPKKGKITIKTEKKGEFVYITISDTGKGMDKETVEKIFDPFFTTKTPGQGTGLGMSISYGIIQKHHGDILVDSTPGKGTSFTIVLPIKNSQKH